MGFSVHFGVIPTSFPNEGNNEDLLNLSPRYVMRMTDSSIIMREDGIPYRKGVRFLKPFEGLSGTWNFLDHMDDISGMVLKRIIFPKRTKTWSYPWDYPNEQEFKGSPRTAFLFS